ncbi:hypothetical protein, partial [Aequoribacter sp.]|uniref:hypothetical protein n=1 Tax=Aequoribacter sp. TaxID=2847771 RepID=UPI003F69F0AE
HSFRAFTGSPRCGSNSQFTLPSRPISQCRTTECGMIAGPQAQLSGVHWLTALRLEFPVHPAVPTIFIKNRLLAVFFILSFSELARPIGDGVDCLSIDHVAR